MFGNGASVSEFFPTKGEIVLQDLFLNQVRKEKIPVTVTLVNGSKLTGTIKGFDNFAIFLKHQKDELIYKHAISSITPQKELSTMKDEEFRNSIKVTQGVDKKGH
ncbi:MAG TPA: RNA chaperone Hfq [Nitrospiria bacterium]|nr:RNA chaperone Hfq [Nitrospiria bacterium]